MVLENLGAKFYMFKMQAWAWEALALTARYYGQRGSTGAGERRGWGLKLHKVTVWTGKIASIHT